MTRAIRSMRLLLLSCSLAAAMLSTTACGDDASGAGGRAWEGAGGAPNGGQELPCYSDADCGDGLVCAFNGCVDPDDGLPPETEEDATFLRPIAAGDYVFALSPDADSAAILDPATLSIEAVILPEEPLAAAAMPGRDAIAVLSRQGEALSVLARTESGPELHVRKLARRHAALALSPDGVWAVLWTPDGEPLDGGSEGIVAVVDALAIGNGEAPTVHEFALGRRHTDVFFRSSEGRARRAIVVGSEEVAFLDLDALTGEAPVERLRLPEGFRDLTTREALPTPDGHWVIFRSFATDALWVLDVDARRGFEVPLPAAATDVDLAADGSFAALALRSIDEVAILPMPAALSDPALLQRFPTGGLVAGQLELSGDGRFVLAFTNAEPNEAFGLLDLQAAAPAMRPFDVLEKWVRTIGLGPDGRTAIVVHRPNPDSTIADAYERRVDQQQGYSIVDLDAGVAQLKLTGTVAPGEVVFAADGLHAGVTLRDDATRTFQLDAVSLDTLVARTLTLASAPEFAGALVGGDTTPNDRVFVTQVHPAGRISFVDLASGRVRTATGYELNADVD